MSVSLSITRARVPSPVRLLVPNYNLKRTSGEISFDYLDYSYTQSVPETTDVYLLFPVCLLLSLDILYSF